MYTLEECGEMFIKLNLTEMKVKDGDKEIILKKEITAAAARTEMSGMTSGSGTAENLCALDMTVKSETANPDTSVSKEIRYDEICAPLVGVFYVAENAESAPYVKEGSRVKKGDVVCIIEAMKMFNDVTADRGGIVEEICVKNGQLVEYNQVLFKLRPDGD